MTAIYVKITDNPLVLGEVLKIEVPQTLKPSIAEPPQTGEQPFTLSFTTDSLIINKDTKRREGRASDLLAKVVSSNSTVQLGAAVFGLFDPSTSELEFFVPAFPWLVAVRDSEGVELPAGSSFFREMAALFTNATVVGFSIRGSFGEQTIRETPSTTSHDLTDLLEQCKAALLDANRNGYTKGHPLLAKINTVLGGN